MRRAAAVGAGLAALLAVIASLALAAGPPVPVTGAASAVTATGAKLAGTVNPNGLATTAAFDYGTSVAYGSSTAPQDAGAGTLAVDVAATLTGLQPSTTYHYRLSASSSGGTEAGTDHTFTTPAAPVKPSVASQAATAIGTTSATIGASVDPNGQQTDVVFDYGTSTAYGASTPSQSAGAGTLGVTLKATISGLKQNTTYHYRARATNATGTTNGADRTFRTGAFRKAAVTTGAVSGSTANATTVTGSVDPNGRPTSVVVQIGTTTKYGAQTAPVSVGSGDSSVAVRIPVGGLNPVTTYHYRLVATSDAGTVNGKDRSFKTPRVPNSLVLSASPARVVYGHAAILKATLAGTGNAGVALSLFASPFPFTGGYALFAPGVRTGTGGVATTQVVPRRSTRYRGTAVVAGLTIASRTLRVNVAPSVTARVARARGGRARVSGVIRPRGAGTVTLRRVLPGGAAVTIKRVRARPILGTVFARYTMTLKTKPGRYRVHVKPDSHGLAAGDSPVVRIRR
jgi:hypothetical protein